MKYKTIKRAIFKMVILVSVFSFIFTACDLFNNEDKDQTPSIDDFEISGIGTFANDGTAKIVTVIAKEGKTTGDITVKYNESTTAPSTVGDYSVTFDVTASKGWKGLNNVTAGTLTIGVGTPSVGDFNISGIGTFIFDGDYKTVTVTRKDGKSTGAITVNYTGIGETEWEEDDDFPMFIGSYSVTFDVAEAEGWNGVNGLSAGTITINDGTPNAPTGVNATIQSATSIRVNWTSVSTATSYNVYYISEIDDEIEFTGTATTTSYTHTDLIEDTIYWYYVTAVNQYGESDYSDYKVIAFCKPDAPDTVEVTATSSSTLTVRWSSVTGATSYKVYYNTIGPAGVKSSWDNNTYTSSTCNVQGCTYSTTYYFFVKAVNAFGESDYSEAGFATTYGGTWFANLRESIPGASVNAPSIVQIAWNRTSNPLDKYQVYYTTGSPDNAKNYAPNGYTNFGTYSHFNTTPNTTYYYWVTLIPNSTLVESGFSEMLMIRTGNPPPPPPPLPPTPPSIYIPSSPPSGGNKGEMMCPLCKWSGDCTFNYLLSYCRDGYYEKDGIKKKCGLCNGTGKCNRCKGTGKI